MSEVLGLPQPMPRLPDPTLLDIAMHLNHEAAQGVASDNDHVDYAQRCTYDIILSPKAGRGARFVYLRVLEPGPVHFISLTMSFRLFRVNKPLKFDHRLAREAAPLFFGPAINQVLVYTPSTGHGRRWNVWHFRLFCDEAWRPDPKLAPAVDSDTRFSWAEYTKALFP